VNVSLEPVLLALEGAGLERVLADFCRVVPASQIGDPTVFRAGELGSAIRAVVVTGAAPLPDWMWELPKLALIACVGVGYDGIDIKRACYRDIAVTAGRGVNDEDVADMALGLLLAVVRHIAQGDRAVRAGAWKTLPALARARSLSRMRCGIVGLGAIGTAIAHRLAGLGCDIAWWGPRPKPGILWPRAESLVQLARDSDALIVAAPSTPESRGSINAKILEALGTTGYLVNISRGDLVDEDALLAALLGRRIAGAALDVFIVEPDDGMRWRNLENVVLTPHLGGWADRAMSEALGMCAGNVAAFLAGTPLLTPVLESSLQPLPA
jgi:lactate dehydrogenase-like 2-hydroxyacid dehydrogenase